MNQISMTHAEDAILGLQQKLVENNVIHWSLFFIDINESWEQMSYQPLQNNSNKMPKEKQRIILLPNVPLIKNSSHSYSGAN